MRSSPLAIHQHHAQYTAQGLETLSQGGRSATVIGGFFVPSRQFNTDRGGVRTIQQRFTVKAHASYLETISNTPIALESNQIEKTQGGSL